MENAGRLGHMERTEHAVRLKTALLRAGLDRVTVADAVGVSKRTITNWTSGTTMPNTAERAALSRLLGDYTAPGDHVEQAIRTSQLTEDRQYLLLSTYKRLLREQADEDENRRLA